jgi:diadenosine tetraphosphate (Ap4A) HIT family hydrolase
MSTQGCSFCSIKDCDLLDQGRSWKMILSKSKESLGHTIFISKKHTASWFDLEIYRQTELNYLLDKRKFEIERIYKPYGYNINISINDTISHCHVHLIPRYNET